MGRSGFGLSIWFLQTVRQIHFKHERMNLYLCTKFGEVNFLFLGLGRPSVDRPLTALFHGRTRPAAATAVPIRAVRRRVAPPNSRVSCASRTTRSTRTPSAPSSRRRPSVGGNTRAGRGDTRTSGSQLMGHINNKRIRLHDNSSAVSSPCDVARQQGAELDGVGGDDQDGAALVPASEAKTDAGHTSRNYHPSGTLFQAHTTHTHTRT